VGHRLEVPAANRGDFGEVFVTAGSSVPAAVYEFCRSQTQNRAGAAPKEVPAFEPFHFNLQILQVNNSLKDILSAKAKPATARCQSVGGVMPMVTRVT
jgi:hypothetical protein